MRKFLTTFALLLCCSFAAAQDLPDFFKNILRQIPTQPQQQPDQTNPAQQKPQAQPTPTGGLLSDVPLDQELAIGRQLAGDLLGAVPLVGDDRLQRYVNMVGRWVASQSERADLDWRFGVLDSADINAFALPGGYVFVTKGLYAKLGNEAELAGVLGHEIGHVIKRHHLNVMKQSQLINSIQGFFAQEMAKDSNSGVAQNILGNGAEVAARGLDKEAEFEADRIGVVLATRAGYDPYGLPTVLQKIAKLNPADASLALLFKTHPLPQDRLMKLGEAMSDSFDRYGDGQSLSSRFGAYVVK